MTPHDKLGHHAGDAEQHDADEIDKDESRASVLPRHIGKTPNIAQADS